MDPHSAFGAPSAWVCRFVPLIRAGGSVLDVAGGGGRHACYLARQGLRVEAVDRDPEALHRQEGIPGVATRVADLENGPWPYAGRRFDAVVVTNYLHRPLFPNLLAAVAADGVLIYETFAAGNERYGRPTNPDFLLQPGELLDLVHGRMRVTAYEDLYAEDPKPAMVQRICAVAT